MLRKYSVLLSMLVIGAAFAAYFGTDFDPRPVTAAEGVGEEREASYPTMKIYFINVGGNGDSALIIFPDNATMLIDAGTSPGGDKVADLLDRLGIARLDFVVVSHEHEDHSGGIAKLGGYINADTQRFDRNNIAVEQIIYTGQDLAVKCVAVNGSLIGGGYVNPEGNENARSIVLLVSYRGFDYLTGGDLTGSGPNVEDALGVALNTAGETIDVYKVHHHGSKYSSNLSFLQKIMPEFAVVSTFNNTHPTQQAFNNLNDPSVHVERIYQTRDSGSGATAGNLTLANGQIVITTDGATFTFTNEGPGSTSFSYGPYQVDEPVYVEQPPHLLITEVALNTHRYPEDHDWIELYLPPDASSIDLSSLYVTDLDEVQRAATAAVTLIPGDVVVLHDANGPTESDATGRGVNGWWDIFGPYTGTWNYYNNEFVLSYANTAAPTQTDIIDAVVWSNDDGTMFADQADDGNFLISSFHWGDPAAGSGFFSITHEGPAIGDIDYGYAQRVTTEDTNSVTNWTINPNHSQGTPPPTPTPLPPPPPPPPPLDVVVSSTSPSPGQTFIVDVTVQPIAGRPFDAYAAIIAPRAVYSIQRGNTLRKGVVPFVSGVTALPNGYSGTIFQIVIPAGTEGDYQIIAGLVDEGEPVKGVGSAFMYDVEYVTVK